MHTTDPTLFAVPVPSIAVQLEKLNERIAALKAMSEKIGREKADSGLKYVGAESIRDVNNILDDCLMQLDYFV